MSSLYPGFIQAEQRRQSPPSPSARLSSVQTPTSSPSTRIVHPVPGITRHPAPTFIPLHDPSEEGTQKVAKPSLSVPSTPGGIMVLATPAMTPALAPDAHDFFSIENLSPRIGTQGGALRQIPVSPLRPSGPPLADEPPSQSQPAKPTSPTEPSSQPGSRDYFSLRGDRSKTTPARRAATETGADEPPTAGMATPGGAAPAGEAAATPGGTLMGRFKGFGKGKKVETKGGVITPAPVVEVSEEDQRKLDEDAKVSTVCTT